MSLLTKSRCDLLRQPSRQGVLFCAIAVFLTVQTARAQVALDIDEKGNVGIGVQASTNSKLAVEGTLTAKAFVGSGSGITGVALLAKDNTFTGNVSATGFTGSGAGLAGVAQLAKDNTFTGASNTFSGNLSVGTDKAGARLTVAVSNEIMFPLGASILSTRGLPGTTIQLPPGGFQGARVGAWVRSGAKRVKIAEVTKESVTVEYPGLVPGNGPLFLEVPGPSFEAKNASGATALLIDGEGQVGIGTSPTKKARLEVLGIDDRFPDVKALAFFGIQKVPGPDYKPETGTTKGEGQRGTFRSIWASGSIVASDLLAFSDARIKNVVGRSDAAHDLATLMKVEVADYTYKDTVTRGDRPQKRVIGQQVEQVFPQAVSKHIDVVPDIFKQAIQKDGWVELATDLKPGERVKLISEKGEEGIHEVLEVAQDRFKTAFKSAADRVFVYGREVSDFRSVNYDAIAMLNVSATQQIKKEKDAEVKHLRAECDTLRREAAGLRSRIERLEAEVAGMRSSVARLDKMEALMARFDRP